MMKQSEYQFEAVYSKGEDNVVADCLNRCHGEEGDVANGEHGGRKMWVSLNEGIETSLVSLAHYSFMNMCGLYLTCLCSVIVLFLWSVQLHKRAAA